MLAGATGAEPDAVELTSDRDGRPALAGAAAALDFNLSHAGRLVVCALSRGPRVGVDVEWIRPLREQALIERQLCAAHERAWLAGLPAPARRAALFELWTAKEACLKALGRGLREEPSGLLVALDPMASRLPETCTVALGEVRFDLRRLSGPRGYRLALATLSRRRGAAGAPAAGPICPRPPRSSGSRRRAGRA